MEILSQAKCENLNFYHTQLGITWAVTREPIKPFSRESFFLELFRRRWVILSWEASTPACLLHLLRCFYV